MKNCPCSETRRREHYAVRMLQCFWNQQSCQGGRNHEKRKISEIFLKENLQQSVAKLILSHRFVFQHDNNPKHTLLLENYLQKTKENVIVWPAQCSGFNPFENLWDELETQVHAGRPSSLEESERLTLEDWTGIIQETCVRLVDNNKCLQTVIQ